MPNTTNPLRQVLMEQNVSVPATPTSQQAKQAKPTSKQAKHEAWRSSVDGNVYWTHAGKCYTRGGDGQKKEISRGEYEKHAAGSGRTLGGTLGKKVKNADGTKSVVPNPNSLPSPHIDNWDRGMRRDSTVKYFANHLADSVLNAVPDAVYDYSDYNGMTISIPVPGTADEDDEFPDHAQIGSVSVGSKGQLYFQEPSGVAHKFNSKRQLTSLVKKAASKLDMSALTQAGQQRRAADKQAYAASQAKSATFKDRAKDIHSAFKQSPSFSKMPKSAFIQWDKPNAHGTIPIESDYGRYYYGALGTDSNGKPVVYVNGDTEDEADDVISFDDFIKSSKDWDSDA